MTSRSHAIAPDDLTSAAGRKTRRVQKKLLEAQAQIRSASEVLAHADVPARPSELAQVAQTQAAAEQKVHEAVEELEVVQQMLSHPEDAAGPPAVADGRTGQGLKSLMDHLRRV